MVSPWINAPDIDAHQSQEPANMPGLNKLSNPTTISTGNTTESNMAGYH
jgi:hypothetical protein